MSIRFSLVARVLTSCSAIVLIGSCASASPTSSAAPAEMAGGGIDCHMHMLLDQPERPFVVGNVLETLREAGLMRGCLLSSGHHKLSTCSTSPCEEQRAFTRSMNDQVLATSQATAGSLLPFCSLPMMEPWAEAEVERCAKAGARGLKLHAVTEGVALKDPDVGARFQAVIRTAGANQMPVLIHIKADDADEVRAFFRIVAAEPAAQVIAAHGLAQSVALLPEAPPNLFLEISGLTHAPAEAGAFFVPAWRAFGVERVLLGSDWPYLNPKDHVDMLKRYPLTPEELHAIVGGNAERLFAK